MQREYSLNAAHRASLDLLIDTHLHALREADLETIMSTVTDDVEYDLVGSELTTVRGRDAVRAHHQQEFANTMHERDVPLRRLYGDGFVVDELVWEGRVTGRVGRLVGSGRRVTLRILRIFEVRDGHVARQSIYSDFASMARQLR